MLGRLVSSRMLLVLLWGAEVCQASAAGDRASAVDGRPACDADASLPPTEGDCSGRKESLQWERQDILDEMEQLEGEKSKIRALHRAFVEKKREDGFLRDERIKDAKMRRDAEVSKEQAAIEAYRAEIEEKKGEIRRKELIKDADLRKLQDGLRQFAALEQDVDWRKKEKAWLEAEIAKVENSFVVLLDAANEEILGIEDKMVECERRIQRIEGEFMQIERIVSDGRDAAYLEIAEREAKHDARYKALNDQLESQREMLAVVDEKLGQMNARVHE